MLSPIREFPRQDGHQRLVHESFNARTRAVITVVASLSFMSRSDPERVTEWRVYWMPQSEEIDEGDRVEQCASYGHKLPEDVARAMFPRIDGYYAV